LSPLSTYTETIFIVEEVVVEVGIRELRNNLSHYLDRVRDGDELTVTDRGRAIARVLPMSGERVLDTLTNAGVVTPPTAKRRRPRPIATSGSVSDLVADQRR
jgi:prevent-host-death family protein